MKIRKSQLRRLIREACELSTGIDLHGGGYRAGTPGVPSPGDYQAVRAFMQGNPELVDLGISMVMDLAGTKCEKSTAQAIIDHLKELMSGNLGRPSDDELGGQEMLKLNLGV